MARDGLDGRDWGRALASGVLSVPVVIGFVALGAVVLVGRSLREVAREAWTHLPARRPGNERSEGDHSDAA